MDLLLASVLSYFTQFEKMDLYLAGEHTVKNGTGCDSWESINILESYYYAANNCNFERLYKRRRKFLLDSGAFTFMQKNRVNVNWDTYVEQYADFINKHDIDLFFELDIDGIIGIDNVEKYRDRLEVLTGKKSIPVWHGNRGKQYFIDMCKTYPYVAIGGLVGAGDFTSRRKIEEVFTWFINTAHQHSCKIHGLGYTKIPGLKKYKFDSVDSTAWLYGNISGFLYKFNTREGTMDKVKKNGCKVKSEEVAWHNFHEWIKFSKYAEIYL